MNRHTHQEGMTMRQSANEIRAGVIKNGYSYTRQCWILNFIIQRCDHPASMDCGCYGKAHAGEQARFAS